MKINTNKIFILPILLVFLVSCGDGGTSGNSSSKVPVLTCQGDSNASNGDVEIKSNDDIARLIGCITIAGDLNIVASKSLTSLKGLEGISRIEGDLNIRNNKLLASLEGLGGLISVGGSVKLESNLILGNLKGLVKLQHIEGSLIIHENTELIDLSGLEALRIIEQKLSISGNTRLTSITTLNQLNKVNGNIHIDEGNALSEGEITFFFERYYKCSFLSYTVYSEQDIINMPRCTSIYRLDIMDTELTSLNGLEFLEAVEYLSVKNNSELLSLNGLNSLAIKDSLSILNNRSLVSLTEFNFPNRLNSVHIEKNSSLVALVGMEELESVSGNFHIRENASLHSLNGLDNLKSVYDLLDISFVIENNPELKSINSLMGLEEVIGSFYLIDNPKLNTLSGLESLLVIDSKLIIKNNVSLSNLDGLKNIEEVGDGVLIEGAPLLNKNESDEFLKKFSSCNGDKLVRSLEDLESISYCEVFFGNLTISFDIEVIDLGNIEKIEGDIIIENTNIVDLEFLADMFWVNGDIVIKDNTKLISLRGIDGLPSFDYNLYTVYIHNNDALINLVGFDEYTTSFFKLSINDNDNLESLEGLNYIDTITFLSIKNNNSLSSLAGLDSLFSVNEHVIENNSLLGLSDINTFEEKYGDCRRDHVIVFQSDADKVSDCITLHGDLKLSPVGDLPNLGLLEKIEGTLYIQDTPVLTNLHGLENLTSVGSLQVQSNTNLVSLVGLGNLSEVKGGIGIYSNPVLKTLDGLNIVGSVDYVLISFNDLLDNISALNGIVNIGYDLRFYDNSMLTNVNGLETIIKIGGELNISSNRSFTSLAGFSGLESVDKIIIEDNHALSHLAGFDNLNSVTSTIKISGLNLLPSHIQAFEESIPGCHRSYFITNSIDMSALAECDILDGSLEISLSNLKDLSGLGGITSITGDVIISVNDNLLSLQGLSNLQKIGGNLVIKLNKQLKNLHGLESLNYVHDRLEIYSNANLVDLKGLHNLQHLDLYYIENNPILSQEEIDAFNARNDDLFFDDTLLNNVKF